MITIITFDELQDRLSMGETSFMNNRKFFEYKLCYIDPIPKTYLDYTPESKEYMQTEEYKERKNLIDEERKNGGFYTIKFNEWPYNILDMKEYDHPDYILGKQNHYAYFTPLNLNEQWGNDWEDAPYECNSGEPHDFYYPSNESNLNEAKEKKEFEILKVPFFLNTDNWNIFLPKDYYKEDASPFSVQDINNNAVAWIYARGCKKTYHLNNTETTLNLEGVSILAGESISSFKRKMDLINFMYPLNEEN